MRPLSSSALHTPCCWRSWSSGVHELQRREVGRGTEAEAVLELSRTAEAFAPEELQRLEGIQFLRPRGDPRRLARMQEGQASSLVNDWGTRFRQ